MQKITPFLWFDGDVDEVLKFYSSVFKDAKVGDVTRFDAPPPAGKVVVASIEIFGISFTLLNGRPSEFKFNESVSFMISTKDQEETDYYYSSLIADGGQEMACGWVKDKFGVAWQVTPARLMELMGDPDREKAGRTMQAMMEMQKIDIATLEKAAAGA